MRERERQERERGKEEPSVVQTATCHLDEFKEQVTDTDMAFEEESIIAVSHKTMRLSQGNCRVNGKELGGPWRFYEPSFPEDYCAYKVKVIVYSDPHRVIAGISTTQNDSRESGGGAGQEPMLPWMLPIQVNKSIQESLIRIAIFGED